MNPLTTYIAQRAKKFKEILLEREDKMCRYYQTVFEEGFEGGYPSTYDEVLESFTAETIAGVLERVRNMVEEADNGSSNSQEVVSRILSLLPNEETI